MRSSLLLASLAASLLATSVMAQTQSPNTSYGGGAVDQQIIGDTSSTADHTNSVSTQLGNSANNNGASIGNNVDTRDQNTVTSTGGAATGGAAIGNQSSNDNKSSASNGNQTLGQVTNGNSSVGNLSNGSSSGGNTLSNGGNTTTSAGGAGGAGGSATGGAGGSSSSNGTNLGINGQQQANNGTNAQGQTSANTNANVAGGNTGGNSANRNSQATNTSAGNGSGSNNRTATSMNVDAADRSSTTYTSKTTVWAPVVHGAGAAPLAAANLVVVPGACSPYEREIVSTKLIGKRFGIWGGQDDVVQGLTDRAELPVNKEGQPILGDFIRRGNSMWGTRVVRALAVVGTSSGASMSLGGFGKNGDGAQGGGAASGQLQQIAVHAWTEECRAFDLKADEPEAVIVPRTVSPKADRN